MPLHNTVQPEKASQISKDEPRQIAAANVSDRYAVSVPMALLIADLQGYRIRRAQS